MLLFIYIVDELDCFPKVLGLVESTLMYLLVMLTRQSYIPMYFPKIVSLALDVRGEVSCRLT